MSRIAGSFEELTEKIADAARKAFPKRKGHHGEDESPWSYVEATFPDHVIVSVDGDPGEPMCQYRLDYTVGADGEVTVGAPDKVKLTVTVVDADDEDEEPGEDDEAIATRLLPAMQRIAIATRLVSSAPEVKALESLDGLQTAAMELMDALAAKGLDMRETLGLGSADVDPLAGDADPEDDEDLDPLAEGAAYEGKGDPPGAPAHLYDTDTDDEEDTAGYEVKNDGRVTLDPATVAAEMAALGL